MKRRIAAADIGGTHARFAIADIADGRVIALGQPVTLNTADHATIESAWREFGRQARTPLPEAIAIAFAGQVGGDLLMLTNNRWTIRPALLPGQLGLGDVHIVNDFGAVAHAVAMLGPESFDHLCGPERDRPGRGTTTIVGPGTGLGVAQLLRASAGYEVIETEGGHIDFAPLDEVEDKILADLRRSFRRVSVERLVSGPGLANLYNAIAGIEGKPAQHRLERDIWTAAIEGSDPLASSALDRFLRILGAVAGDLALAHGANAVVIAGGLGYRLKDRFRASGFAERFTAKGRFERRMANIGVELVNYPEPGLYGAAAAFAREFP